MTEFEIKDDRLIVTDRQTVRLDCPINSEEGKAVVELLAKESGRTPRGFIRNLKKIGPKEL